MEQKVNKNLIILLAVVILGGGAIYFLFISPPSSNSTASVNVPPVDKDFDFTPLEIMSKEKFSPNGTFPITIDPSKIKKDDPFAN